jgi:DNA-binding SARP family transcriptional activator/predicted ATPase/Tfp pilus assembly protein PilF
MSPELRLTLLGDCRIELGGEPLASLALSKAQALLCYLAVTGRPQPRSEVTDLLWGELNEADARRNLRVVLAKLRSAVGDYVLATRSDLAFNRNLPHTIDATTFEHEAQALLAAPEPLTPNVVTELERLFALYRGDFMRSLEVHNAPAFEEWLVLQREHLRRLALQVGERLANHYESTGQDSAGIAVCQQLIELDPLQESTYRRLMLLLARSGQPAAALRQFERCRRALAEELGVEPDAATLALAERIRLDMRERNAQAALDTTSAKPPHNLPAPTTPFVGRAEELVQIEALLADPACRLLTLIGIGGVGKTRLALQVAHNLVTDQDANERRELFRHGITFVPLAAIATADQMIAAIAGAMRFTFSGRQEIKTQLLNHVREKEMLLILDNFEHLVHEAPLLTEMLQAASGVKLLVTSRERLDLYEEWLFDVDGLSLPPADRAALQASTKDGDDALLQYSALQLFALRARRLSLRFDLAHEPDAVADICRLMEGLPLGIELASGWVRTHTCDEIARAIQRNLDFLSTSAQNVPERHRSLRVAFDYSWDMLTQEDAHKLARLVVFRGAFDDAAAEAVTGAARSDLDRLADKSLVERAGNGRWSIHEMLRQYLADRLVELELRDVQTAHSRFYAGLVAQRAPARETSAEPQVLDELRKEIGNLRAAWEWMISQVQQDSRALDDADTGEIIALVNQFAPMLAYFYVRECWYQEGWRMFTDAQQAMRDSGWGEWADGGSHNRIRRKTSASPAATLAATRAMIESLLAEFAFSLSDYAAVIGLIERALPALRDTGNQAMIAEALARLGKAHVRMGHYDEAEPILQESLSTFESIGDRKGSTAALNWLAAWHSNQGRFDKAQEYFEACLAIFREYGYARGIANTLNNLGSNYGRNDRFAEEQPLYEEAYQLALEVGEPILIAVTLSNMGDNARSLGDFEQSRRYYERSLAHCREMGERRWIAANLNGLGLTLLDTGELEDAWDKLQEALAIAREIQSVPDMLDALAGLGEVLAKQGRFELATTLLDFVVHHPVTQRMARERSRRVLADFSSRQIDETTPTHVMELELDDVVELVRPAKAVTCAASVAPGADTLLRTRSRCP